MMSPAHTQQKRRKRVALLVAGLVTAGGLAWAATAFAATGNTAAAQTISCPRPQIGAVPAAAQAEVNRELANLDKQIAEANTRLRNSVGQGGPNFVQNAILGPLAGKRTAALDRIAIAIGRVAARPQGLERFATCSLSGSAAQPNVTTTRTTAAPPAPTTSAATNAGAGRIVCPTPQIGAVPAAAQAEVNRELANLDKQIAEANTRLQNTVGQGGPNFVQNAILGPLAGKRTAALDRIAIAIGRVAARPQGLQQFATCQLQR
jgi:flagellar motility protein MotE (MotC chaperone)